MSRGEAWREVRFTGTLASWGERRNQEEGLLRFDVSPDSCGVRLWAAGGGRAGFLPEPADGREGAGWGCQ